MGSTNAFRFEGTIITGAADEIISSDGLVVKVGAAEGGIAIADAGDLPLGVTLGSNDTTGSAVAVQIDGIAEVVAGGAVAKGALVYLTGSAGKVDDVDSGVALGLALTAAAAADERIVVDLTYKGAA